ncbi:hypothetical protein KRP22_009422 [Phytophthora ramorum]|nr:hypothetical protein KRP22_8255 [Phytophthora ramorum]
MATSYKAARQCDTTVDYLRMARSRHFATFKGHAKKLEALEQSLVREMKEALREQRRLDANIKEKTKKDWQEELSHCKVLHHQTEAELKKKIIHLEERDVVRLASVTELQNELQSVKHDFKQLQESQPAKTETSLSHAELVVLKASLDKQREDQQKSRSDLTELAAKLSAKQKELEEEKTSLATKAADQLEEGLRLQTQMKLNKKMEHSVRMAFDEERAKDSAENEIWRDGREAMTMELNRAIRALQGQIEFNECSEAAKRWKYISDEYNQQKEEALEECAANRRRKDQLRFEFEKAKETIVELERESAEFKLKLYSYRLCGITEKRIQLFAGRYSTNPDNIVSRNKQRQFAVNLMQSCSDDEAKQLDEDMAYFVQTRNVLCHDGDGNKAFEVDHRKLQYCCRSINSALVGLQAFMCNK